MAKNKHYPSGKPKVEEGYNSRVVRFLREIAPTEPLDFNDVDEMERRFAHYIEMCELYDQPISNLAAYSAIGITKSQAENWEHRDKNERKREFIRKVRTVCGTVREFYMLDGKVPPVTGIWWQKNYDGLRDVTETISTKIDLTSPDRSIEEIKQRYLEQRIQKDD